MNKLAIVAFVTALVGCQTTGTIKEPERTQYYFYCIANRLLATTCQCMEETAVKETGITSIRGLENGDPKVEQFLNALTNAIPACKEATDKLLKANEAGE